MSALDVASRTEPPLTPTGLPLTPPQYGMWAGQAMEPDSPAFWTAEAIELEGPLDPLALARAVIETLAACDALHMRYRENNGEVRQFLDPTRPVAWTQHDFSDADDPWQAAHEWMRVDLRRPARLDREPLFATALLRLGPDHHLWYLRSHHITLDGFAYLLLIHQVAGRYNRYARTAAADAVTAEAQGTARFALQPVIDEALAYRASARCARDRDFWRRQLTGRDTPATLAPLRPPSASALSERHRLPLSEYARWQAGARACGVDWSAWLVAGIAAWLHQSTGASQACIGLLVMNRLGSAALTVPCMAMNVVPLHLQIEPDAGFDTLARQAAGALASIRPHQRYNYEWMREDMGLAGSHAQLYGPVLNLMPFDRGFHFDGLASRAHPVSVGSVEDLDITVSPLPDGLRIDIEANPAAYDPAGLRHHHDRLLAVLGAALDRPDAPVRALADTMEAQP